MARKKTPERSATKPSDGPPVESTEVRQDASAAVAQSVESVEPVASAEHAPSAPQAAPARELVTYTPGWTEQEQARQRRQAAAESLVTTHAVLSGGAGFLPVGGLDLAAMSASQIWLLKRLSALYGVDFTDDLARKLVATLLAGFVPLQLAAPVASTAKMIPLVGSVLGGLSMVAVGGAVTYAIGRAFIQHFESGGTLLTFDPAKVRAHFEAEYRQRLATVLTSPR